jgi:hypothetical protein
MLIERRDFLEENTMKKNGKPELENGSRARKLSLHKRTLKSLGVKTAIKAGAPGHSWYTCTK